MPSWGAHTYLWASSSVFSELDAAIEAAARHGLDFVQISVTSYSGLDVSAVRASLERNKLACVAGLALPHGVWRDRRKGSIPRYLEGAIDATAALRAPVLSGALYTPMGITSEQRRSRGERIALEAGLREAAQYARDCGIRIGLEPLNRYETAVINTAAEGLELVAAIGEPNVFVHLDTFHMNIEEDDLYAAFMLTGTALGYVQLVESDRGVPREGHMPWEAIFSALRDLGYDGPIAFESFTIRNEALARAACLWRDVVGDPDLSIARGLEFVRRRATAVGYPPPRPEPVLHDVSRSAR